MKTSHDIQYIGVPWVTPEAFPQLLEVSTDDLPDTYAEWKALVEGRFARHIASGLPLQRVYVDPDEMAAWCGGNGMPVDSRGRGAFAAFVLMRRDRAH